VQQIIIAHLHEDSFISRDDALNQIVRLVDTAELPTDIGTTRVGTWKP
jgi:hypothetical protein